MTQEQDKVIRKTEGSVAIQTDRESMELAMKLKKADVDKDGKISKEEMLDFMIMALPDEAKKAFKDQCINPNDEDIILYQRAMEKASTIAVNIGLIEEVVVPSVPSLCAKARNQSQSI